MSKEFKDHEPDAAGVVEKTRQKYAERRKQSRPPADGAGGAGDEARRHLLAHRSAQTSEELRGHSKALHELLKAFTSHPDRFGRSHSLHGSNEDLCGDSTAAPLQDSQVPFTETDVTLPSCLGGSPGSHESETDRQWQWAQQIPDSCRSSSLVLAKVSQEMMMMIYEQLKAERQSQRQWERELNERETKLKQQEEAAGRLTNLEEMLHTRILAVEEKHQQELHRLQGLLQERTKENKRLKSSFDILRELNDNMKKQLSEISEQNKKLESHSKRVQARLENLQRRYEHSTVSRRCQKGSNSPECIKQCKKTSASVKPSNQGISSTTLKLVALLLDWVLDGRVFSSAARAKGKGVDQCLPLEVGLTERCLKALPILGDQLHHTSLLEPDLLLNLLRLIHSALRHLDNNTQHVALSATLRRIGEEVSKPTAQPSVLQRRDPDVTTSESETVGHFRNWPLYRSPCPHTRILSILIILRTVTQADVVAQALASLHTELKSVESRGLFIHYEGVCVLLSVLRAGCGGLHTPMDILMQLTEQSRYLNLFLDTCSCEEFFRTTSQLLKHSRLELPLLEKLSMLLQKLSSFRKNRRLFELSSLHLQIQDLYHKSDHAHTFLCLNLRSILHNLR